MRGACSVRPVRRALPMSSNHPPAPPPTVDSLIERCLAGDQQAWDAIVRLHWRKVFNVAYKFVGKHDEAEDLTQDIFLKIFRSLNSFDRRANFQTWLISVSRNLCIDHYRSVRKERETMARDVDASELSPASKERSPLALAEHSDLREMLRQSFADLVHTPRVRATLEVLELRCEIPAADDALATLRKTGMHQTLSRIKAAFRRAEALGQLREDMSADSCARTLHFIIGGALRMHLVDPEEIDLERDGLAAVELALRGCARDPSQLDAAG